MEDEQRFRELVDLLPQPVFEFDLFGRFTFANQSAFETFGYTPEEMEAGVNVLATVAPDERDRAWNGIQAILHTGPRPRGYAAEYTALIQRSAKTAARSRR